MMRLVSPTRLLFYWIAALISISTLLVGTVHYETQAIISLAALLLFPLALYVTLRRDTKVFLPLPLWGLFALLLLTLFQMIPMPQSMLARLSPHLAEVYQMAEIQHAAPISYALPLTILEAMKLLGYMAVFFGAYRLGKSGRFHMPLLKFIGLSGAVFAVIALVHKAFAFRAIFGLYEPVQTKQFFAPFVSANHASGFFLFALFVLAGAAMDEPRVRLRYFLWIATLPLVVAILFAGSRGGVMFLVGGAALFTMLYLRATRKTHRGVLPVVVLVILVALVPLLEFFVKPFLGQPLSIGSDLKVAFWQDGARLVREHLFMGVGKGGFHNAFTHYLTASKQLTPDYAENILLQQIIDFGLPAVLLILSGALFLAARFLRRVRYRFWKVGAITAVLVLVGQNFFDFNLEFPSTAIPLFAVLGILSSQRLKGSARRSPKGRWSPVTLGVVWCLFVIPLTIMLFARGWPNTPQKVRRQLVERYEKRDYVNMVRAAARAQRLYPADYFLATARGLGEMRLKNGQPLKWIGLGSWLFPLHHYPDLAAARYLVWMKRLSQAKVEYRLAFNKGARLNHAAMQELLAVWPNVADLVDAVPRDGLKRVMPYLTSAQRLPFCSELYRRRALIKACYPLVAKDRFGRSEWSPLLDIATQWISFEPEGNLLPYAYKLRALWSLDRYDKIGPTLKEAHESDMRNSFIKTTLIMWHLRDTPDSDARAVLRKYLASVRSGLSARFYLLKALESVGGADDQERQRISLELKQFVTLGRVKRSRALEALCEPLWRRKKK